MTRSLRTARLELTPLGAGDAPALHALWTAPGVRRHLWDDRRLSPEQTRDLVARSEYLFAENGLGLWGAREQGASELIGFAGYWFFRNDRDLELLYGVAEPCWHRGYGTELARAMVRFGFDELRFEELRASTDAGNESSLRLLKRLGFLFDRRERAGAVETLFYRLPRQVSSAQHVRTTIRPHG